MFYSPKKNEISSVKKNVKKAIYKATKIYKADFQTKGKTLLCTI
jgi:hypothetical protein